MLLQSSSWNKSPSLSLFSNAVEQLASTDVQNLYSWLSCEKCTCTPICKWKHMLQQKKHMYNKLLTLVHYGKYCTEGMS